MRSLYAILLVNLQGNARYLYWTLFYTMNNLKNGNLMWGESWDMRPNLLRELRRLTCLICLGHSTAELTNVLRYHLFLKKKRKKNIFGSYLHAKMVVLSGWYLAKMPNKLTGSSRSTKLRMARWKTCSPKHVDIWTTNTWSSPHVNERWGVPRRRASAW